MALKTVKEVAERFYELALQEKWFDIQDELFAENVKSIEPEGAPYLKNAEGKKAVRQKGMEWVSRVTGFDGGSTTAPVIGGDFFAVGRIAQLEMEGIGALKTDELMVYEVKDGQIVAERFFY